MRPLTMGSSPIAILAPEILLQVFSILAQDTDATVAFSILCCKKWQPLAQSVLYSDIHLSGERLVKFSNACSSSSSSSSSIYREIRSLTLHFGPVLVNQYEPQKNMETTEKWLTALRELVPRIGQMTKLESFSISADLPVPYSARAQIASIIEELPATCVALEVDLRHSTSVQQRFGTSLTVTTRMCDSIRSVLSRIHHLRLRLSETSSACFGEAVGDGYQSVIARNLKSCVINLAQRTPGIGPRPSMTVPCPLVSSVLPALISNLQSFAQANPHIQRLWVVDLQARRQGQHNSWAAWIRRDIVSGASWPVPLVNIGGFRKDAWLARLPPSISSGGEPSGGDMIASPEILEAAAEGFAWSEAQTGVRLPTSVFMARDYVRALDAPRTRSQLQDGEDLSCTLWENEDITGESVLPSGPGALMQMWDLNERTPDGWERGNFAGSTMVRPAG